MPITIPKSILLTPKVPTIAVVGLMLAQFVIFNIVNNPEPTCTLKVERPHHSTSIKERLGIDAIKLNITSECTAPQEYTVITAQIQMLENNREIIVSKFLSRKATAISKSSGTAVFKNLFTKCKFGDESSYRGSAEGFVRLKGGKEIRVEGNSGKYEPKNCAIGAQ
jgi:hypothetical protein